jgi:hypothetical protein
MMATVIAALLGGMGGAVLAQGGAAADVAEPVLVDITITNERESRDCSDTTAPDGVIEVKCTDGPDYYIEASDPRLSGPVWSTMHENRWEGHDIAVLTEMYVIENEGGTWRGTRHFVEAEALLEGTPTFYDVLAGEAGYEGLMAFFAYGEDTTGVILPRPVPEPLEPDPH